MTCACYKPTGQICGFHQREEALARIHSGYPRRGDVHCVEAVTYWEEQAAREARRWPVAPQPEAGA